LTQGAVMVDLGKAEILEGKMAQSRYGLGNTKVSPPYFFQEFY